MAAVAACCCKNTACLQRQRCINSHAQTQRTVAACSSNKNGPAACAAGCFEAQSIQRWETARTAPRETCPCGCRTTTACATACEWKKNELLHHSRCYSVALLLCILMCSIQNLSGAPFAVVGFELRRVRVSKKKPKRTTMHRTHCPSFSNDIVCFQRIHNAHPLCTLSAPQQSRTFSFFFASCSFLLALRLRFIRSAPPTHHQRNRSTSTAQ